MASLAPIQTANIARTCERRKRNRKRKKPRAHTTDNKATDLFAGREEILWVAPVISCCTRVLWCLLCPGALKNLPLSKPGPGEGDGQNA